MLRRASFVLALLALTTNAAAADLPPDVQRSLALYEQGRKLVDAGDCVKALPLFEESIRYNESIGAHLSLAECRGDNPLAAWDEYKRAELLAKRKNDERARYAHDHAAALAARLALVQIVLPSPSARALVDANAVADVGEPIAVEPGPHVVDIVSADGARTSKRVVAKIGETVRVTNEPEPSGLLPRNEASAAPDAGRTQRSIGVILAGGGAPLAIVGGIFAIVAASHKSDAESACPAYPRCTSDQAAAARDATDAGRSAALVSTIGVAVGLVAIAAGTVLYFTAPRGARSAAARAPLTILF